MAFVVGLLVLYVLGIVGVVRRQSPLGEVSLLSQVGEDPNWASRLVDEVGEIQAVLNHLCLVLSPALSRLVALEAELYYLGQIQHCSATRIVADLVVVS